MIYHLEASCDSNDFENFPGKCPGVEKKWCEIFYLQSNFERVKRSSNVRYTKLVFKENLISPTEKLVLKALFSAFMVKISNKVIIVQIY